MIGEEYLMDGIQRLGGPPHPPVMHTIAAPHSPAPSLTKGSSDYLRALRRRTWLVLAIGVSLSVAGAVLVVRMPAVFRPTAQISIEPPAYDPVLSTLVSHDVGRNDPDVALKYVPNQLVKLQSKGLAEQVVSHPDFDQSTPAAADPAQELLNNLQTRPIPKSDYIVVSLEGTDPERTTKQLNKLLEIFRDEAEAEKARTIDDIQKNAMANLDKLTKELEALDKSINEDLKNSKIIAPGGKNLQADRYERGLAFHMQKQIRLHEIQQQANLAKLFPSFRDRNGPSAREAELADLKRTQKKLTQRLSMYRQTIRSFDSDPAVRRATLELQEVMDEIYSLRATPAPEVVDPHDTIVGTMQEEIRHEEELLGSQLGQVQASMPEHHRYLTRIDDRKQKTERIANLHDRITNYEFVSRTQKSPVTILGSAVEPTIPVRPGRFRYLAMALVFSFGLAMALVCLMEYLDHSVKVPEHLTFGLNLPLLGVVPRMRRTAKLDRGGHLWTPGAPDSVEADAYRNVRASLLGISVKRGPIVTLLVASAKAGEGKSTTALNLAATCARAGERTLLMDVDLRRPSLAEVFREDEQDVGLVDVLRGELPWQRTVIRTDIANLDFLPTGQAHDIPIEILGTLELRQLLIALSSHYDRVILDGPAILGLADCRMLGRVVDAAVLVVRSGLNELRPLQRAKAMLEQSHVAIAGVVFNGLFEDLKNWSCYGPNSPSGTNYGYGGGNGRSLGIADEMDSTLHPEEQPALPMAGSFQS